ncbi:MAG: glycosyltransferase family 9 protein [Myxococcales bacterium]
MVVWQPAYLGDVVFASPLTAALARRWPEAEVLFVARPPAHEIAQRLPGVSAVLIYDKRGKDRGLSGARRVLAELRAHRPELWLSLHGSLRSGLFARAARAHRSFGPAREPGSLLFGARVSFRGLSFPARAVALAAAIGLEADPAIELRLGEQERAVGREIVGGVPAVALIPGSEWETKRWPAARFAELARRLRARGRRPVLLGAPGERRLCAEIAALAGGCLDLCGGSVSEALAVLSACEAALGGDSGLVHAARALAVPTVALFGPTDPRRHVAAPRQALVSLGLSCSPCSDHGSRRCPLGHHRCLSDLSAERAERELSLVAGRA